MSSPHPSPWKTDPNKTETLRRLWLAGVSPVKIAKELGAGLSRHAIIGKAHRLNLPLHSNYYNRLREQKARDTPLTMALIAALKELDECLDFAAGWPACRCFPATGDINKAFDKARSVLLHAGK